MGRPRKFETPEELKKEWDKYKKKCNNKKVLVHDFSSKNSEFVTAKLKKSVTYTIEGFCVFAGISRAAFYEHYANDDEFADTVTLMREECEIDAREKFELGVVPTQLAGLWMSNYGYSTKTDTDVNVKSADKLDNIMSQLGGEGLEE